MKSAKLNKENKEKQMNEIGKIMKKTKSNMAKLTSSSFGTGSFVYMEEKVPGKSEIPIAFYERDMGGFPN